MFQTKIREFEQQRRRRLQTRHLKSEFALLQTLSLLFNPIQLENNGNFFSGVELQRIVLKFRKRNRKLLPRVHVSTKRKNRKFHGVVKQRRQRTVPKCVMHVQSYRFANQNLLLFCCSSCRHCCSRLRSLIL